MKPKEIIEKEKLGYIELTDEQIEKYIIYDEINGSVYFSYDYEINKNQKGNLHFGFKTSYDCDVEVKKKWFGLFEDKIYNIKTDIYYYNDDLKIFFEQKDLKKISNFNLLTPYSSDFLEVIKKELKKKNYENEN